jgi:formiminoglutamase
MISSKFNKLVENIDNRCITHVYNIIKLGKTPIIGVVMKYYGNIKTPLLPREIMYINFGAHSDFRSLRGRHSGSGTHALWKRFLKKILCLGYETILLKRS